jgi:hypothetical protein
MVKEEGVGERWVFAEESPAFGRLAVRFHLQKMVGLFL